MPFDVQWFIFALVSNGVMSRKELEDMFRNLGPDGDLGTFAQLVLEKLSQGLSQEDAEATLEQLQAIIDYSVEQGDSGIPPEYPEDTAQPAQAAAPAADDEEALDDEPKDFSKKKRPAIAKGDGVRYPFPDIDLNQIKSFEDLPSLDDVMSLSDEEVAGLMLQLLTSVQALQCSDLHLSAMSPPFVRRNLILERFGSGPLSPEIVERLCTSLLTPDLKIRFDEDMDLNYALEIGTCRYRVCLMVHKDGIEGSYRLVPDHICSLQELGFLPQDVPTIERMLDYNNGLILVTGPLGAGKTTTLASMVHVINEKRTDHVITVEDPIEILHTHKSCQITQREIGLHTISYHSALKAALREDPDIIVIGELHDLETIENAITASETGHLVIGTLHTSDAAGTLNRVLDAFPPAQQAQIRTMVAGSLRGIVCQKLIPGANGKLTIAYEILTNSMSVGNLINEGKTFQLKSTMAISSKQGMCTLDQNLLAKYMADEITYDVARGMMRDSAIIAQIEREFAIREARKLSENMKKK